MLMIRGFCALLITAMLGGCAAKQERLRVAEYYYEEGMRALERKRHLDAVDNFQRVVSSFPGSALVADAQYHLAEAYFRMEDFVNAIFEYQRLMDSYPRSAYVERAQFQVAESYFEQMRGPELDQKETFDALTHFRYFIDDNPDSPLVEKANSRIVACRNRLAEKRYKSAQLYHRRKHFEAARMEYEDLVRLYPETKWYAWGMAQLGDIARRDGDYDAAREYWQTALAETGDEKLRRQVEKWLRELE